MAYSQSGWNRISSGANNVSPTWFSYKSTADALATIVASGYFNDLIQDLTNGLGAVKIGDVIYVEASDTNAFVSISAVTTAVTVTKDVLRDGSFTSGSINASKLIVSEGNLVVGDAADNGSLLDMTTSGTIIRSNGSTAVAVAGPSHIIRFAGQPTTAGGAAAEAITVTGALAASDYAFVQMVDDGTNNTTIVNAVVTDDTLTVTFSGDPGADAVINYQIIRAIA